MFKEIPKRTRNGTTTLVFRDSTIVSRGWIFLPHWFSSNYVFCAFMLLSYQDWYYNNCCRIWALKILRSQTICRLYTHIFANSFLLHTFVYYHAQIEYNGLFLNWWGHHVSPLVISPVKQGNVNRKIFPY